MFFRFKSRFKSDFKKHREIDRNRNKKDLREIVSLFCLVGVDGFIFIYLTHISVSVLTMSYFSPFTRFSLCFESDF